MDRILKYMKVPPDRKVQNPSEAAAAVIASKSGTPEPTRPVKPRPVEPPEARLPLSAFMPPSPTASGTPEDVRSPLSILVPDFTGMTLKEAASMARHLELAPTFEGNGVAIEQLPRPGAPIPATRIVQVSFSPAPGK